jgi:lipopolysaccharide export system permease protein
MSLLGAIGALSLVRGAGFIGTILGTRSPVALLLPYLALAIALGLGAWGISRGLIIEPPAFISDAVSALVERFTRRDSEAAEAAR